MVCGGITTGNSGPPATTRHVIRRGGKVVEGADSKVEILSFGPDDVFIKGANAIDVDGNAGILTSSLSAGRLAWSGRSSRRAAPAFSCRSAWRSSSRLGHRGRALHGYLSLQVEHGSARPADAEIELGQVITEIQALALLAGVRATHIGSGGVGGSEGAVVLSIEGEEAAVDKAFELVKSIKGEPPVAVPETLLVKSAADDGYDPQAQLATLKGR